MSVLRTFPRALDRLLYFIRAREQARETKELVGGPGPHSSDPILAVGRFCNINREHDVVTKWVKANVRDVYAPYGKNFLVPQVLAARIFNEPDTLREILPALDPAFVLSQLSNMRAQGRKIMRGAYMMPVHGNNGKGKDVAEYYMAAVAEARSVPWSLCESLEGVAERLVQLMGIGDFLANQVCADLRYTPGWGQAKDWGTFVLCGPGSRRGIDRYDAGRGAPPDEKAIGNKPQRHYRERLLLIREELVGQVSPTVARYFADPNNLSNTFCEFDKFERALWSAKSTLRKYT